MGLLGRRIRILDGTATKNSRRIVVNSSLIVRRIFSAIRGLHSASTGVLVLNRGKAKGSIVTHLLCHGSPHCKGPFIAVSLNDVPRRLFRDRLFNCRGNTFASTQGTGTKHVRITANNALFLSRVNGLSLPVRTGLLATVRGHYVDHLKDARTAPVSIQLVYTAGTSVHQLISRKSFHRSLLCHVGAVRLRVPPLQRHKGSVLLLTRCFLRQCTHGCRGRVHKLAQRTGGGLLGCT